MQYYFFIRENLKRKKKGFEKENRIIFLFEISTGFLTYSFTFKIGNKIHRLGNNHFSLF